MDNTELKVVCGPSGFEFFSNDIKIPSILKRYGRHIVKNLFLGTKGKGLCVYKNDSVHSCSHYDKFYIIDNIGALHALDFEEFRYIGDDLIKIRATEDIGTQLYVLGIVPHFFVRDIFKDSWKDLDGSEFDRKIEVYPF